MLVDLLSLPAVPPDGGKHGVSLRRTFSVAQFVQSGAGLLEDLAAVVAPAGKTSAGIAPEHTRPCLISRRVQFERLRVVGSGGLKCVDRERTIARLNEGETRLRSEPGGRAAGDACEFEGAEVVVGQHLSVILGPAESLDPRRGAIVLFGPHAARNLAVRDILK